MTHAQVHMHTDTSTTIYYCRYIDSTMNWSIFKQIKGFYNSLLFAEKKTHSRGGLYYSIRRVYSIFAFKFSIINKIVRIFTLFFQQFLDIFR